MHNQNDNSSLLCSNYIKKLKIIHVSVILLISAVLAVQWLVFKNTSYQCVSFMLFLGYILYSHSYKNHSMSISLSFELKGRSGKVCRLKSLIIRDAEISSRFRKSLVQILNGSGSIHITDLIKVINHIEGSEVLLTKGEK